MHDINLREDPRYSEILIIVIKSIFCNYPLDSYDLGVLKEAFINVLYYSMIVLVRILIILTFPVSIPIIAYLLRRDVQAIFNSNSKKELI